MTALRIFLGAKSRSIAATFLLLLGSSSQIDAKTKISVLQTPKQIDATDEISNTHFKASLESGDMVALDIITGFTRVKARIDYIHRTVDIESVSHPTGNPAALLGEHVHLFRALAQDLPSATGFDERLLLDQYADERKKRERLSDALGSLLNFLGAAPAGVPVHIIAPKPSVDNSSANDPRIGSATIAASAPGFTSLCANIGSVVNAVYTDPKPHAIPFSVGPACFNYPAEGRCGAGAGPSTGSPQRFTQECLNHDVCCDLGSGSTGTGTCGTQCVDEYNAAVNGFFFAPDCGSVATQVGQWTGNWVDLRGNLYTLTGGGASGPKTAFSGSTSSSTCGNYSVTGTQRGRVFNFTRKSNTSPPAGCPSSETISATLNNCNGSSTAPAAFNNGNTWWWYRQLK